MNRKIRVLIVILLVAAVIAMVLGWWRPVEKRFHPVANTPRVSKLVENLQVPWALGFLPNNRLLVTERKGTVRLINLKQKKPVAKAIAEIKNVVPEGEGGLLGIAIYPHFKSNQWVYLYYTYRQDGKDFNKVVRFDLVGDQLKDPKTIIDKIPASGNHDGGRVRFGPDGFLYITTGDAGNPKSAQNVKSLAGKILRLKPDGTIPDSNPFPNSPVYSYGHRNPEGIAWDKAGNLWETEHGPFAHDEINLIKPGENYGWPVIEGNEKRKGMVTPILQSGLTSWAPAGAAIVDGKLYFAGLRGSALYEYNLKTKEFHKYFPEQFGRLRAVAIGPNHLLYVTTSNRDGRGVPRLGDDKILVVDPKKF